MDAKSPQLTRRTFVLGSLAAASLAGLRISGFGATAHASHTTQCSYVPWESGDFLNTKQLQATQDEMLIAGYQIIDITGYDVLGKARYTAVWERRTTGPASAFFFGQTRAQFLAERDRLTALGYLPVRIRGYVVANTTYYASIWEQSSDTTWSGSIDLTADEYRREHDKLKRKGFRAVDLNGSVVRGVPRFACIFEQRPGTRVAKTSLTRAQLDTEHEQLTASGYRLLRLSGYSIDRTPHYAAIWELASGPEQTLLPTQTRGVFRRHVDEMRYRGFSPAALTGFDIGQSDRYVSVWDRHGLDSADEAELEERVNIFLDGWDETFAASAVALDRPPVPGLSLAIAKNGQLVYARGFGVAKVGEGGAPDVPVTVHSLFRVASASKSITAAAVLHLVAQRRLALNDAVFGPELLGDTYGTPMTEAPVNESWPAVTVRHLLEHSVAGWGNDGTGLVFIEGEKTQSELIEYALATFPITAAPGSVYDYSGFCYLLLGRIIEVVTEMTYETYVQQVILGGASTMAVAGNDIDTPGEVRYYADEYADAATTLAAAVDADDTSWTVTTEHDLFVASPDDNVSFNAQIDDEVVRVLRVEGTTWEVRRARSESTAAPHAAGWSVIRIPIIEDPYSFNVTRADAAGGWAASTIDLVRLMTLVDGHDPKRDLLDDEDALRRLMVTASPASSEPDATGLVPYGLGWILNMPTEDQDPAAPFSRYYGAGSLGGTHSVMMRTDQNGNVFCFAAVINTNIKRATQSDEILDRFGRQLATSDVVDPMMKFFEGVTDWPSCYDLF